MNWREYLSSVPLDHFNDLCRNAFGSSYRPALGLNGYIVTVDECEFIERKIEGTNNTVKYLQQDRLFLLRDFEPDFEQADISIVITVRGHYLKTCNVN